MEVQNASEYKNHHRILTAKKKINLEINKKILILKFQLKTLTLKGIIKINIT